VRQLRFLRDAADRFLRDCEYADENRKIVGQSNLATIATRRTRSDRTKHSEENGPMKTNQRLALAVLAGVLIGVAGAAGIHAQQVQTPPAYLISEADTVTDPTAIKKYGEKVPETLAPFSGHYHFVVRGGKTYSLEGAAPQGTVVIAFDSVQQARAWYDSPAYQTIKPIRQSASKGRMFIVEGLAGQ
jgi:uncharacterized protein (DUF1330 family)